MFVYGFRICGIWACSLFEDQNYLCFFFVWYRGVGLCTMSMEFLVLLTNWWCNLWFGSGSEYEGDFHAPHFFICGIGPLPPSRCRSLFTLATAMIIFSAKAYEIHSLVSCAKATLNNKLVCQRGICRAYHLLPFAHLMLVNGGVWCSFSLFQVDPFLCLVGDSKLQAVNKNATIEFGSKEDDSSALRYLSDIIFTEDQTRESFAAEIVRSLEKMKDVRIPSLPQSFFYFSIYVRPNF